MNAHVLPICAALSEVTMTIKIRLNTTNGSELYPEDYILTVDKATDTAKIESFIDAYKKENADYYTEDVANAIAEHFGGSIKCITFSPDVDVIV
jgi:spore coat polysaccharide biosynthesis protein SpsF (cytidylyltransferase family)